MESTLLPRTNGTFSALSSSSSSRNARKTSKAEQKKQSQPATAAGASGSSSLSGNSNSFVFEEFMRKGLELKPHAPRIRVVTFKRDRLVFLLGPGGNTKRQIEQEFNCVLDVGDGDDPAASSSSASSISSTSTKSLLDGGSEECVVHVFAADKASCEGATKVSEGGKRKGN